MEVNNKLMEVNNKLQTLKNEYNSIYNSIDNMIPSIDLVKQQTKEAVLKEQIKQAKNDMKIAALIAREISLCVCANLNHTKLELSNVSTEIFELLERKGFMVDVSESKSPVTVCLKISWEGK